MSYELALASLQAELQALGFDFSELTFEHNKQRVWWPWPRMVENIKITWPNKEWESFDIPLAWRAPEIAAREVISTGMLMGYYPWGTRRK